MAQFRFVGDPNDDHSGPDVIEWDGYVFRRDGWTEVPDDCCAKLRGNSHFVEREAVPGSDYSEPVNDTTAVVEFAPRKRGRPPKVAI